MIQGPVPRGQGAVRNQSEDACRPFRQCRVDGDADKTDGLKQVTIGDKNLCEDTTVESNTDDWSGRRVNLAKTGAAIGGAVLAVIALASTGIAIITARRRKTNAPAHAA
ncbi:LPXTG cell wall anchor domain-containing protein [Bifidobacterium pseudocatenulatum]|nr:LPXTG cell wall anchor domain-containing protein [Bifidobacterium pseudocatenulatum]